MASPDLATSSNAMAPDAMADYLRERLGDKVVDTEFAYGQLLVTVTPEAWVDAVHLAKEDEALACRSWEYMDAVDRGEDGFEGVVNVYSVEHRHRVTFKTMVPGGRDEPRLPTLTGVFRGANWSEREVYDMFGIEFEGHPGLLPRILTVENFDGWPLRKEFLLSTREAKPWPGSKEPAEDGAAETAAGEAQTEEPKSAEQKAAEAKERAERAREKAAAMRAKKAAERAQAEGATAEETAGGDTEDVAADQAQAAAGKPEPQTPEGAADIAGTPEAKDAAAGSVAGDTAAGASGDAPGVDEPVDDPEAEAKAGEGAAPAPSGAPGVEEEGRHTGADVQEGERPGAETPGMDAEPGREGTAARAAEETPAPAPEEVGGIPETGQQQVPVKPLADEVDLSEQVTEEDDEPNRPTSSEPPPPPSAGSGTDADDRREGSE
jgi:NADH:ubiquinone oxidoreductase subunit C